MHVTTDVGTLLTKVEQGEGSLERVQISFNAERYDTSTNATTSFSQDHPEASLRNAYHIEIRLANRSMTMTNAIDLPAKADTERIPVEVTSFPDSTHQLPVARVEVILHDKGRTHSIVRWFDYVEDRWMLVR